MPAVLADLSIEARWIVPMTVPGRVLEHHTLVVRDGRILDLLPTAEAARYAATVAVQRPRHLLMPGMINSATCAAKSLFRGLPPHEAAALEPRFAAAEFVRDGVLVGLAEMLRAGVTCFGDRYDFPDETARVACEQGMRALIGLPVAETPSPWAQSPAECLTLGLRVRDEYKGHPLISTAFAPQPEGGMSDATFARVVTLADELDAGIVIDLHASERSIAQSVAEHGMRPIERLWKLGLLTPALRAVHMNHASKADMELAERTGIAISLSSEACLGSERRLPPAQSFLDSSIRVSVASAGRACGTHDVWAEMRLLAAASGSVWGALAAATCAGAAACGMEDLGLLATGKWADLCCLELGGPATLPLNDPVTQLVFCGGRDMVRDVWVAGRPLLSEGELTRLDWAAAAERAGAWARRFKP